MIDTDFPVARAAAWLLWTWLLPFAAHAAVPVSPRPALVVQITVDQLRGDMIARHLDGFGSGGFRRLLDQGVWYTSANYGTGNTFTCAGHAVLVTGADTSEHGIVANYWFDRVAGRQVNCVSDTEFGSSPRNLGSTTIGDEIVAASGGRSRSYAVAGKARSAVVPAGRRGIAYWYSESDGTFGNSRYYGDTLPSWVRAWNDARHAERYRDRPWTRPEHPAGAPTDNGYARPYAVGRSFPHRLPKRLDAAYFEGLPETPFFDELVLGFAGELIAHEKLGTGSGTDYLSVSLSSVDYVGHSFGPESAEYTDTVMRLDAQLAAFLAAVEARIGRDRVVYVLSADHGVDDIPEARAAAGYDAGRLYPAAILERANAALAKRFQVDAPLIAAFVSPNLYLDRSRIAAAALDARTVEVALAEQLRGEPGIAAALTHTDLLAGDLPQTAIMRRMQRSFHPARSGDVVVMQKQFWYLYPDPECCASMHGSPYAYDTHVPVILAGPGLRHAVIERDVEPASIAPTLAALLGISAPSGNAAPVLDDAIADP